MSLLVGFTTVLIFICGNCKFYGYYWSKLAVDGLGTSTVVDENLKSSWFKGTLMQIWKSLCIFVYIFVFIQNQYPENFALLILKITELFAHEVCKFIKK